MACSSFSFPLTSLERGRIQAPGATSRLLAAPVLSTGLCPCSLGAGAQPCAFQEGQMEPDSACEQGLLQSFI